MTEGRSPRFSALLGFLVSPRNPTKSPDRFASSRKAERETLGSKGDARRTRNLTKHGATSQSRENRRRERKNRGFFLSRALLILTRCRSRQAKPACATVFFMRRTLCPLCGRTRIFWSQIRTQILILYPCSCGGVNDQSSLSFVSFCLSRAREVSYRSRTCACFCLFL